MTKVALTQARPYRVVVVDDSMTMRRWLQSVIDKDARLEIVGMAASADEARAEIKRTHPDVITLDIEMPGMNGLEFLAHLMRLRPMPVVMLSSALHSGTSYTERARKLGAVACIAKPGVPTASSMDTLCDTLVAAAERRNITLPATSSSKINRNNILLVGASTGGVAAIETMLTTLDKEDIPPIVIAQHMPHKFLTSFAERLDRFSRHSVALSRDGMKLEPGCIRVAPSQERQTGVVWYSNSWHIQETPRQPEHTYCPSVDVLFASAAPWAEQVGAALLTGLGNDGAKGLLSLRQRGARTIGQSRDSCTVYGMPGAALSMNATQEEAAIDTLGLKLLSRMRAANTEASVS